MQTSKTENINPQRLILNLKKNIAKIFPNEKPMNTKISIHKDTITVLWQNHIIAEYIKNELMAYCDMEKSNIWGTDVKVDNVPLYNVSSFKLIRNVPSKSHTKIISSLFEKEIDKKLSFEELVLRYNQKVIELEKSTEIKEDEKAYYVSLFRKISQQEIEKLKLRVSADTVDFYSVQLMASIIQVLSNEKIVEIIDVASTKTNIKEENVFKSYINKFVLTQLLSEITYVQKVVNDIIIQSTYYQRKQIPNIKQEMLAILGDKSIDINNNLVEITKSQPTTANFLPNESSLYVTKFEEKIISYLKGKYDTEYLFESDVEKLYNLLVKNFNAIYHQAENENKYLLWLYVINLSPFLNKEILRQVLKEFKELKIQADAKAIQKLSQLLANSTETTITKYVPTIKLLDNKLEDNAVKKFTHILSYLDTENIISPQTFHQLSKSLSDNDVNHIQVTSTNIIISLLSTYKDIVDKKEKELEEIKVIEDTSPLFSEKEAKELMRYYQIEEVFNKQNSNTGFENSFVNKLYLSNVIPILNAVDKYELLFVNDKYVVYWNNDIKEYIFDSVLIRIMFSKESKVDIVYHASHIAQSKFNSGKLIGDNQLCRLTNLSTESAEIVMSYHIFMLSEHREMMANSSQNKLRKQRLTNLYRDYTPKEHKNILLTADKIGVVYQQYQVRNLLITNIISTNSIYTIYEGTNFNMGGILATKATDVQVSNHIYTINSNDVLTPQKYFGGLFNRATDLRYTI